MDALAGSPPIDEGSPALAARVRHHLAGRTRLEALQPLPSGDRQRLAGYFSAKGWTLAGFNPLTRSALVLHPPERSADEVRDVFVAALRAPPDLAPGSREAGRSDAELIALMAASPEEALDQLDSNASGLDEGEASRRLAEEGENAPQSFSRRSRLSILRGQVATLPVALLAGSAMLSLATGGVVDAAVTLGVVALNAGIGVATEGAVEALVARLAAPVEHAAVIVRTGRTRTVSSREVVRGDLIALAPGQVVPADARLIQATDLSVDESMLTGESLGVDKVSTPVQGGGAPLAERRNMVHAGTVVLGGQGLAVAVRTGARTEVAMVRSLIASARPPKPVVEEKLDELSRTLAYGALAGGGLILGIGLVRRHPLVQSVRSAVSLTVASLPEGLPAVATTAFALEARAMERRGVYVRMLPAIESIGAIDTLCLDKTGTLTENRMGVAGAAAGSGLYATDGGDALVREDGAPAEEKDHRALAALAEAVALCNTCDVDAQGAVCGSGTEVALLAFAGLVGQDVDAVRKAAPVLAVRQRSQTRRYMSTLHRRGDETVLFLKGAPEDVLPLCAYERRTRGRVALDDGRRADILAQNQTLASRGQRVLGVARRRSRAGDFDPERPDDLEWLGLVGLSDPLRPRARQAIETFQAAGIRTVMITGDQPVTACAVAESLDLAAGAPTAVLTGADMAALDDGQLAAAARSATVFARVTPADKLRIVRALQSSGSIVGVLGDGVNDGPALREAQVGVAMGRKGTDIAREVADVVIAEDDLVALARAVARGRSTDDNIRNSVRFLVATNLSEILVTFVEAFGPPAEQETPMELLWLNLVTDVLPAIGLAVAEPAGDVMERPPAPLIGPILDRREFGRLGVDALQIAGAALAAHFSVRARAGPGAERSATFLTLAGAQLVHAFSLRDRSRKDPAARAVSTRRLELAVAASAGLLVLPFAFPALGRTLGVRRPAPAHLGLSAALVGGSLAISELRRSSGALAGLFQAMRPAGLPPRAP